MIGGAKGIGIGIDFGIPNQYCRATSKPYIEKDVLDSLRIVASAYGKSNDDADRSIVKNLVDADNPFVISNAAFKLNSGFGKYEQDFTDWRKSSKVTSFDSESIKFTSDVPWVLLYHPSSIGEDIPSFKVRIKLYGEGTLYYNYITQEGKYTNVAVKSEIFETPICYNTKYTGEKGVNVGFTLGVTSGECSGTITQIPSFEGAFVTDGINDLITSTKTVQEMLGGSNEITVVSMIHQVKDSVNNVSFTNYIRGSANGYFRNIVNNYDKTGIYGYTSSDLIGLSVVNNILGDKNDYTANGDNRDSIINGNFSVQGYSYNDGNNTGDFSSVAWYWTIIANKVLTTDQINQVIAYFNLDRTLKPDILCDVKKQGITNDNHAEFGDKLIDFSGNGRDIQLNNIAWKRDSGIGKYETELSNTSIWTQSKETTSSPFSSSYNGLSGWIVFANTAPTNSADMPSFKIQVKGLLEGQELIYRYYDSNGQSNVYSMTKDGEYTLPSDVRTAKPQTSNTSGFQVVKDETNIITITQIPSHAGAFCLDGVNDFGKVTGMPVYKDYTFIIDRQIISIGDTAGVVASKSEDSADATKHGAFIFEYLGAPDKISTWSFYKDNGQVANTDFTRGISYQSKYSYNGKDLTVGTSKDSDKLWLGTIRDRDSRFFNGAIYSLMSFPYSMSEFLIERQLKKYKLGTLYPNMVEFRPVIKSNASYDNIVFYYKNEKVENGTYLTVGSSIGMHIRLSSSPVNEIKSITVNGIPATFKYHDANNNIYQYDFNLTSKSPQNINITIDEYIRFEDIVQPYPVLLRFKDENGNEVSWGGKFKVGSTITRIGSAADSNLLPNIYNIFGLLLNDNQVTSSKVIVEKTMVFKAKSAYIFDNNEPNCILSPRLLRIPNSSYKILGHIPDISGHGNHGVIHNSAYAEMSGANGYPYDYRNSSFWCDSVLAKVVSGELIEYFAVKNSTGFSNITSGVYKGEIKVTGVTKAISENKISRLRIYTNSTTDNELIDITQDGNYNIDKKGVGDANRVFFYAIPNNPNESIVVRLTEPIYIEQVGEYEGAYCFDGVDDFVTIPTTVGGKQVLMKVNWQKSPTLLYDQRASGSFAVLTTLEDDAVNPRIAYQARNQDGKTYIDGIENNYIETYTLKDITHNITIVNSSLGGVIVPVIGCNTGKSSNFAKMSLYDFMLFDNISTDDKIKELNEYVGVEAKVELPPYYWDAYGKTNSDADRDAIQQRGIAVGDYDLTNYNHAYEGMSGYNAYPVVFGIGKTYGGMPSTDDFTYTVSPTTVNVTKFNITHGFIYSYLKHNGELETQNSDYPSYKIKVTGLEKGFGLHYSYLKNPSDANLSAFGIGTDGTYTIPKSFASDGSLINNNVWIGFIFTGTAPESCNVTIEVLPEYENGLAYDGVTDYSENANIPALTDFTYVFKRKLLDNVAGCASMTKGLTDQQRAVVIDYINTTGGINGTSFGNMAFVPSLRDSDIIYSTTTNINGTTITKGNNPDSNGIDIGKFVTYYKKMVFYKLILYPKTIPLLQINFLKNLMERDEIIDLNNPIFIQ
jgi:hypothetical protein